jgi:hypothetical protein
MPVAEHGSRVTVRSGAFRRRKRRFPRVMTSDDQGGTRCSREG